MREIESYSRPREADNAARAELEGGWQGHEVPALLEVELSSDRPQQETASRESINRHREYCR